MYYGKFLGFQYFCEEQTKNNNNNINIIIIIILFDWKNILSGVEGIRLIFPFARVSRIAISTVTITNRFGRIPLNFY